MTNDLSSTLDSTLNAICAMINDPLAIHDLNDASDDALLAGLKAFCVRKHAAYGENVPKELVPAELIPNWSVLAVIARQMHANPPAILDVTSEE